MDVEPRAEQPPLVPLGFLDMPLEMVREIVLRLDRWRDVAACRVTARCFRTALSDKELWALKYGPATAIDVTRTAMPVAVYQTLYARWDFCVRGFGATGLYNLAHAGLTEQFKWIDNRLVRLLYRQFDAINLYAFRCSDARPATRPHVLPITFADLPAHGRTAPFFDAIVQETQGAAHAVNLLVESLHESDAVPPKSRSTFTRTDSRRVPGVGPPRAATHTVPAAPTGAPTAAAAVPHVGATNGPGLEKTVQDVKSVYIGAYSACAFMIRIEAAQMAARMGHMAIVDYLFNAYPALFTVALDGVLEAAARRDRVAVIDAMHRLVEKWGPHVVSYWNVDIASRMTQARSLAGAVNPMELLSMRVIRTLGAPAPVHPLQHVQPVTARNVITAWSALWETIKKATPVRTPATMITAAISTAAAAVAPKVVATGAPTHSPFGGHYGAPLPGASHAHARCRFTSLGAVALRHGATGVLSWLAANKCPGAPHMDDSLLSMMVENGHMVCVKWLVGRTALPPSTDFATYVAARRRDGDRFWRCRHNSLLHAIRHGHVEMVRWVHEMGIKRCSIKSLQAAASSSDPRAIRVIQWAATPRSRYAALRDFYAASTPTDRPQHAERTAPILYLAPRGAIDGAVTVAMPDPTAMTAYDALLGGAPAPKPTEAKRSALDDEACGMSARATDGDDCPVPEWRDAQLAITAAGVGRRDIVQWLHETHPGSVTIEAARAAASLCHTDVIIYLHQAGVASLDACNAMGRLGKDLPLTSNPTSTIQAIHALALAGASYHPAVLRRAMAAKSASMADAIMEHYDAHVDPTIAMRMAVEADSLTMIRWVRDTVPGARLCTGLRMLAELDKRPKRIARLGRCKCDDCEAEHKAPRRRRPNPTAAPAMEAAAHGKRKRSDDS